MSEESSTIRVLLVEDDTSDAYLVQALLARQDYRRFTVTHTGTLAGAMDQLAGEIVWDVVVLDLNLPDSKGVQTFEAIAQAAEGAAIVVRSGASSEADGERCVRLGAQNFLDKDMLEVRGLARALTYAVIRQRRRSEPT